MRFTTRIEFGVDVNDCIGLYANADTLLNIVINKYQGKCTRGMFVEKIVRIVNKSNCMINKFGSPHGMLSVDCEIIAIKYATGEIINGCVIEKKDKSGLIVCTRGHVSVLLTSNEIFESMVKGQIMSARVHKARYIPNTSIVTINATPFLPSRACTAYACNGTVDKNKIKDIRERVEAEETTAAELRRTHTSAYTLYEQLLFPYPKQFIGAGAKEVSIVDFISNPAGGYVSRDPRMNPSRGFVFTYDNPPTDVTRVRDDLPFEAVVVEILEDYCAHLRTIREYVELYSEDQVRAHANLWAIYKKNKDTPVV